MTSHRAFIQFIASDNERFTFVEAEALRRGVIAAPLARRFTTETIKTANQRMQRLLDRLASWPNSLPTSTELGRLLEIVRREQRIRHNLNNVNTWQSVCRRWPVPIGSLSSVELVSPGGRCNYHFRLSSETGNYVVRYHDPIGKDYLQIHEPRTAVYLYTVAEHIFRLCIGTESVVDTLYPRLDSPFDGDSPNEDNGDIPAIIAGRILFQPDYSSQYFLLARGSSENPPIPWEDSTNLLMQPLATLHAQSRCLDSRSNEPPTDDLLATEYRRFLALRRFVTPADYGAWVRHNWIANGVITGLSRQVGIWPYLIAVLGITAEDFLDRCGELWSRSEAAMAASGALVRLDHTPENCFVARKARDNIRIFDFDYLTSADTAFDLGITLRSVVRTWLQVNRSGSISMLATIIPTCLSIYRRHYTRSSDVPVDLEDTFARARQFAALALASSFDEEDVGGPSLSQLSDAFALLFQRNPGNTI